MDTFRSVPRFCLTIALLISAAHFARAADASAEKRMKTAWDFELLPKPFQKNPDLKITVISELSEAGKQRPVVTTENPVRYVLHSGGYQERGEPMKQKPMAIEEVEKVLRRALEASGYLPASAEHPPAIAVIYTWGAHNVIRPENAVSHGEVVRNVLDRAALAGGSRFASELAKAFQDSTAIAEASARPLGSGTQGTADLGAAAALNQMAGIVDPVRLFKERNPKNDFLLNQATSNCFYLIASAFDYESLVSPRREMLWRTRMTVNSDGVSQLEAIPMLVSVAAPYFGRDMTESETISKKAPTKSQVEVGDPTLIEAATKKALEKK